MKLGDFLAFVWFLGGFAGIAMGWYLHPLDSEQMTKLVKFGFWWLMTLALLLSAVPLVNAAR